MTKKTSYLDLKAEILQKVKKNGGWVNAHAHIDRAYTVTKENIQFVNKYRHEKWKLNAEIRKTSTVSQIYDRMARATELFLAQDVSAIGTFIDVDPDVEDKAIRAAQKVRDSYKGQMTYRFINQASYGILTKETRKWFDVGVEFVDIVGGLVKANAGHENEYLDIIMLTAKAKKKMIHLHVDELNDPEEKETEWLAKKTIEHGMQGRVVGIHGISINAHPKVYREELYQLMKQAQLMMVACPMSWLNARRSEVLTPTHNPVTPIDELLPHGIPVAIGGDNLYDIFMPFNDGNMWNDMRVLMEANRFYDADELVKIATVNGRKVLGLG